MTKVLISHIQIASGREDIAKYGLINTLCGNLDMTNTNVSSDLPQIVSKLPMPKRAKNFECKICTKRFESNRDLQRHFNRIRPCDLIVDTDTLTEEERKNPNRCKFCGRGFAAYANLIRHIKINCKIAPRNGDMSGMEKLYEHVTKKQAQELEKVKKQMEEQATQIQMLLKLGNIETKTAVTAASAGPLASLAGTGNKNALVNINKGMIDQSTKTVINIFGSEDTSHITHADILKILQEVGPLGADLRPAAEKVILQTAMLIHSDEKHPENITCYIPNQKGKNIMVHRNGGWTTEPSSLLLSPMAHKAVDVLFEKQPYPGENGAPENIEDITRLMRFVKDNEGSLVGDAAKPGSEFRAIGIRNKAILEQLLPKLPAVGDA